MDIPIATGQFRTFELADIRDIMGRLYDDKPISGQDKQALESILAYFVSRF